MRVVVAIDSFKGSLSSLQAGEAVRQGIQRVFTDADVQVCPLADGGEGTVEALTIGLGGSQHTVVVTGPVGKPVEAVYGILPDGCTAVMEMSAAAGITLISPEERDPMRTTTYGVGEMICHAISNGCRQFIIGIGGSATNDGGVGMLQALGYDFLDATGKAIPQGARGLKLLASISNEHCLPELKECRFRIACDVTNPLCGEKGCSVVFSPQKGGTDTTIPLMDRWLKQYALLAGHISSTADPDYPGAGAAGGVGFAFRAFTNAVLESGISIVLEETGLEQQVQRAQFIVTGEGRLDGQTAMGKAPIGVARLAKKYGKPVIAFAGCLGENVSVCNEKGIDAYFPILQKINTLEEALDIRTASFNLSNTAEQVFRLIKAAAFLEGK